MVYSPDGRFLAYHSKRIGQHDVVGLWDTAQQAVRKVHKVMWVGSANVAMAFTPDGSVLASAIDNSSIVVLIHTRSLLLREAADLFANSLICLRNDQLCQREWLFAKISP
jgi:hypothetical protein